MTILTTAPTTSNAPSTARTNRVIAAWAVHAFTMSGLLFATLATISLIEGYISMMWLWLGVALVVDGVDGSMARKACVKQVIPWFDGAVLDNIIDYITWTFLPALFMYMYLPFGSKLMALVMALTAIISSVFCYANEGEKSSDNYFVGFPAAWNIVAVIMYVLETPAAINIIVTVALAVLTLAPLHFTHPMRVKRYRTANMVSSVVWIASTGVLIATYPAKPLWALAAFAVSGAWFLLAGVLRTVRGN